MAKQKRHNPEQITRILAEHEAGATASQIARRHGISEQTFYRWKAKFGGIGVSEVRRLKALEDENRRLKKIVADKELDIEALKVMLEVKL